MFKPIVKGLVVIGVTYFTAGCYYHNNRYPVAPTIIKSEPVSVTINLSLKEDSDTPTVTSVAALKDNPSPQQAITTKVYIDKPVCTELEELYNMDAFALPDVSVRSESDKLAYMALLIDRITMIDAVLARARNNGECRKQVR